MQHSRFRRHYLEVYEIGNDYVLGRYFDPEEAIPQVKLYVLRRERAASGAAG